MNVWKCPICMSPSPTFKLYVSHLRLVHSKDPSFKIMCGVDNCREVFGAFSAFNSHVYRHHREIIFGGSTMEPQQPPLLPMCGDSNQLPGHSFELDILEVEDEDSDSSINENSDYSIQRSSEHLQALAAAKFILKLREGRQISQIAISDVMMGCKNLCKHTVDEIKEGVKATLESAGMSLKRIPGIAQVLDKDPDPFRNIHNNYLFEKFCTEHLGYLVRMAYNLYMVP